MQRRRSKNPSNSSPPKAEQKPKHWGGVLFWATKMKTDINILVAILTGHERQHWIHPDLLGACLSMPGQLQRLSRVARSANLNFMNIHGHTPVDAARNAAVVHLLESGANWLLQLDNDTVPPIDLLNVFTEMGDRKIVGLPYISLQFGAGNLVWCAGKKLTEGYRMLTELPPGWSEVDFIGAGCLLVHRDVFLALGDPWFECPRAVELRERTYAGEDGSFCQKAQAKGFSIWTNSAYPCRHYRTVDLLQAMLQQAPLKPKKVEPK